MSEGEDIELNGIKSKELQQRYYGKNRVFWIKDGEARIVLGPHWYLFVITFGVNVTLQVFFLKNLIQESKGGEWAIMGQVCIGLVQLCSYLATSLINPGIVTALKTTRSSPHPYFCHICNVPISPTTKHCNYCQICIQGFDHHCPWTGKCIGQGNISYFYSFIFFTFLNLFYIIYNLIRYTST